MAPFTSHAHHFCHSARNNSYYYLPIFTTQHNDVPVNQDTGAMEVRHLRDIYYDFRYSFNDHPSPYSEDHPDVLERRMHEQPDIEKFSWVHHKPQWYVGVDTCHALNGAYRLAVRRLGDAVQPNGWNRNEPWLPYNFASKFAELGMPYIERPSTFHEGVYHAPYESYAELQREIHLNNLYAICTIATAMIIDAVKENRYSNLVLADYMRGSPALIAGHRHWCRSVGYVVLDRSEDSESAADFEQLALEQQESENALVLATPPDSASPMDVASLSTSPERAFSAEDWQNGGTQGDNRGEHSFASTNMELVRSFRKRRNDIDLASNTASTGSSAILASNSQFDLDDLIDRLAGIATFRAAREITGSGDNGIESKEEWPIESASPEDPTTEPSVWPRQVQQTTPPLSWEDYWNTMRGEGLTNDEIGVGSDR
ncbi:hypothetical protein V565_242050 [Rhizoctonia solani 123E]|uniref:Uncharacterized protein n=1 Tax=Rhizoctonia solani 123E TaxID=1423351 RepID=A0A074RFB7_9AGAM|nr:hypothetical protein V565_242050 [Rhizoctonia solani 123E]